MIIPAYNEEEVIVDTLTSIDAAAAHYGGPVRIILTNDGSTDRTRPLAEARESTRSWLHTAGSSKASTGASRRR